MLTNTRQVRIEWGDCDPAGIIFYPRYFEIFDASTNALFERALGLTKFEMLKTLPFAGFPLVRTEAKFLKPTRYGDDVVVDTTIKFGRASFEVEHRLSLNGELCAECVETRVWVVRDADGAFKSQAMTDETPRAPLYVSPQCGGEGHSISAAIFFKIARKRARSRCPMMRSRLRSCIRAQRISVASVFLPAAVKVRRQARRSLRTRLRSMSPRRTRSSTTGVTLDLSRPLASDNSVWLMPGLRAISVSAANLPGLSPISCERRENAWKVASCAMRRLKPIQLASGPKLVASATASPFLPSRRRLFLPTAFPSPPGRRPVPSPGLACAKLV
jgi:4-hydroxybenzoyl-CoA thioesterase